jgi:hypothetical protein
MKKKNKLIILASLLVLLVGAVGTFVFLGPFSFSRPSLAQAADDVIDICSQDTYPPRCYDVELPKLMDRGFTMEEAFEITRLIQNKVHDYYYCHVLGHNLSAKETAKDPLKWTDVVARCPIGMCSNGCLHGAAQERFRSDVLSDSELKALVPELAQTCEPSGHRNFTGLEQASCYHSLGHLTMYVSGADIIKATDICDQIAKKRYVDYTQTCYEGAYMQIFQPLEPEDFALVQHIPATTTALAKTYCDSFSGERRAACHRESWPLYREKLGNPADLQAFCSLVSDPVSEQRCYNAMFYVLTAQYNFDETKIIPLCEGLPQKRKAQCFANSASRLIETDYRLTPEAVALCEKADEHEVGDRCYTELLFYSSFNFHEGSEAFAQLCNGLPGEWKDRCLRGEGKNIRPTQDDT